MRRTVTCNRLLHNGAEYLKGDVIDVDIAKYPQLIEETEEIIEVSKPKADTPKPKTKKKAKK
jgi:hypothetical protein